MIRGLLADATIGPVRQIPVQLLPGAGLVALKGNRFMCPRSIALATFLAILALLTRADAQTAQGIIMVRDLSLALATEIAQAALEHCRAQNFKIGVSVVDRGGHVLISMRDDGTAHHVIELAERKAYTARIFRQTTGQFVDRIINNPRSQGLKDTKGVLASLGGVPIKVGDDTIGGVGVSGAPGGAQRRGMCRSGNREGGSSVEIGRARCSPPGDQ